MDEMRSVLTMAPNQMEDWKAICTAAASKFKANLLFVNSTSCGMEFPDGSLRHIYIDEMVELLKGA